MGNDHISRAHQRFRLEDISMTVRLVVSCNGIKINTVRDVFKKSLRARLLKTNPDTDYRCLETFGSMFSQDIPIHAGTTISFRRTTDGHLITERAIFDMYIGDVPTCEETKEEIGKMLQVSLGGVKIASWLRVLEAVDFINVKMNIGFNRERSRELVLHFVV